MQVVDVFKLLPLTDCRECGFASCRAFATALAFRQTVPRQCPELELSLAASTIYPVYDADGAVVSTVAIANAGDRPARDERYERQKEYIAVLEKRLAALAPLDKRPSRQGRNNDIQITLSSREVEVLRLIAEGCTNTAISETLAISHHTVKSHVVHIFNKLGVNDRTQAAVWAARNRLL